MAGEGTSNAGSSSAQDQFNSMMNNWVQGGGFDGAMDKWWEKEKSKRTGNGQQGQPAAGQGQGAPSTEDKPDGIHNLWGLFRDPAQPAQG